MRLLDAYPRRKLMTCRRCSVCVGMDHHWLEDVDEADPPAYTHRCKHCPALGLLCDDCDNAYGEETDCDACLKAGVVVAGEDDDDA